MAAPWPGMHLLDKQPLARTDKAGSPLHRCLTCGRLCAVSHQLTGSVCHEDPRLLVEDLPS
eukprot:10984394-Alexandrium_andersonii.AAC.1